jgi:tetratricopeptide (TPR) repeat protein
MARIRNWLIFLLALSLTPAVLGQQSATDRSIALSQALAASTNATADYDKLGAAYIQKGRETSDFVYYELAEKALTKSLELTSPMDFLSAAPLTHLAIIYMAEHRFSDAADCAERGLAVGSGDLSPFGLLGDAHADMGDYDQAAQDYEKLLLHLSSAEPVRGFVYMHDSRVSYLKFIHGDNGGAIELVRKAANVARGLHMPAENLAWTNFQLGEYLYQDGDLVGAEAAYQDALNQLPGYYRGLSGVAKVRVAQKRYQEAIEFYKKAIEEIPFPDYIAALGDIYTKVGKSEEAKKQYDLVEYIGYLTELNKQTYNRELALFYADHDIKLHQSLELARRELEVRRDVYTHDVLAWSLYKNGKLREASAAMDKALSAGTRDATLYFHAGLIHRGLGDVDGAREFLDRALAINPNFHIFYADIARRALEEMQTRRAGKLESDRQ